MSKFQIQSAAIQADIDALKVQLAEATQNETLVVGSTYTISVGRAETARVISATLIGERVTENGTKQYRFSAGEGFDARFYDLPFSKVVVDVPEGQLSSDAIGRNITRLENKLAKLAESIAEQEAREALVEGQTYNITVGKPSEAVVVPAVLLGTSYDEKGNKQFKFFYGSGFDSTIVVVNFRRVQPVENTVEPAQAVEASEGEYPSVFDQQ